MIYLFNSLSREKEEFKLPHGETVGMYSCGPTVYDYSHIGHMRRYVGDDILKRVLEFNDYKVKHVMNITDVGHLTSDADTGEDKVEKKAKEEGKSAWDIAKFFEQQFFSSTDILNIKRPSVVCRATGYIQEQVDLIKRLEEKGFTYKTSDGVYFNTSKFPDYGKLSGSKEGIKPGARVDVAGKKNPTDFALWKFSPKDSKRQMEWDSPWGVGFPGWHIECSAMSMKYLGETFDVHTGGVDHIPVHHENEIAQSEAATGKPFVKYWIHHEFLMVDGQKMAKSLKNIYTVDDAAQKGFDPLALRYLFLTAHYRDPLNFTWQSLDGAQNALSKIKNQILKIKNQNDISKIKNDKADGFKQKFIEVINDDLNTPQAIAVMWDMLKSDIANDEKYPLLLEFDKTLGLGLDKVKGEKLKVKSGVNKLMQERDRLRAEGKWNDADGIRRKIEEMGYSIEDSAEGTKLKMKS